MTVTYALAALVALLVILIVKKSRRSKGAEWARTRFDPAAYGLVPRERLTAARGGPPISVERRRESQAIADAAWGGNWRPAAAHVEAAGQDWDERWSRLELLASIAQENDGWLASWRTADPDSCDAAVLEAKHMVHNAWEIRGYGYAPDVPAANMARFRELLPAGIEAAQRAALLAPQDPAPWVVMVTAARGAQYKPAQFRPLWAELTARAPHHFEGHWQAMQYWCAKWFGSDKKMLSFAKRAMDRAPAGSALPGIYLFALSELEKRNTLGTVLDGELGRQRLRKVSAALAGLPADDERLPTMRHLLAHYCGRAGLYTKALEQFRLIGRWCGAAPWTDHADPVAAFDLARGMAVKLSNARPLPPEMRPAKADAHHYKV
ncbi:hypothetical protein ACGFZP_03755 [Kitasatospora sp. NPDC048239]|uniref:hypothetical protein n=1 Tax=Kitasatospora sp. NPDC048239 TaxID=3364046 RepID=UPI00371C2164